MLVRLAFPRLSSRPQRPDAGLYVPYSWNERARIPVTGVSDPAPRQPPGAARRPRSVRPETPCPPHGGRRRVPRVVGSANGRGAAFRQLIEENDRRYLKALNPEWPDRITEADDDVV